MQFKKQVIDTVFKCYSVNGLHIDGKSLLLFAGEGPGICRVYGGDDFSEQKTVWEGDGGVMSMVGVPDYEGYFFASKGFFSMVDCGGSGVYLVRFRDGVFSQQKIIELPYLHRFDVFTLGSRRFFIGATLHSGKVDKEDWSRPGAIYVAELPLDLDGEIHVELQLLRDGLYRNHGFNRGVWKGMEVAFIASDEGVFAAAPPQAGDSGWTVEQVFSHPVSDVAAIDLDGDGEVEFALLSPFHGNRFDIYKKVGKEYRSVFSYPEELDFYHAIYADTFNSVPTVIAGARKDGMDLFLVQYDPAEKAFKSHLIERGAGSSNARILHTEKGDLIVSANRQIDQAAVYRAS